MSAPTVLDLFSGAAGGWSLGLHRAGLRTVAACENDPWRAEMFRRNNPGAIMYPDVGTLTAERIKNDLGYLPDAIFGSPPCQDASAANVNGKGLDGARTGLFFEAVRLVDEIRPRWCGFENVPAIRTRGVDRLLAAMEAIGYAVQSFVVGADDVGANHRRKRVWFIAFDPAQVGRVGGGPWRHWAHGDGASHAACVASNADSHLLREQPGRSGGADGRGAPFAAPDARNAHCESGAPRFCASQDERHDALGGGRLRQDAKPGRTGSLHGHAPEVGRGEGREGRRAGAIEGLPLDARGLPPVANEARRTDGRVEPGLRQAEVAISRRGDVFDTNGEGEPHCAVDAEMGGGESPGGDASEPWADWNGGPASHIRLDARVSAGLADRRGLAGQIVAAFGDAVVPAIPELIGRAIRRVELEFGEP